MRTRSMRSRKSSLLITITCFAYVIGITSAYAGDIDIQEFNKIVVSSQMVSKDKAIKKKRSSKYPLGVGGAPMPFRTAIKDRHSLKTPDLKSEKPFGFRNGITISD
jgi:hypothetical protein